MNNLRIFLSGEKFRRVILFPFLFLIVFLALNSEILRKPYQEMGDHALNAMQIENAGKLKEALGPYSRGGFHHFGPISFYYYALMEYPLFYISSEHGRHLTAQLFLNLIFFLAAMFLLYGALDNKRHIYLFYLCFLVALGPISPNIFLDIWGPSLLVFPMLLFLIAIVRAALGAAKYLTIAAIASVFIAHNHIGAVPIIVPIYAMAVLLCIRNENDGHFSLSRVFATLRGPVAKYLGLSLAIVVFASMPPLIEQFIAEKGNISRILEFAGKSQAALKLDKTINFIFTFYVQPLPLIGKFASVAILPLLFLFVLPHFRKRKTFFSYLSGFIMLFIGLSLIAANRVNGGLVEYLFWHSYSVAALLYFSIAVALASSIPLPQIEAKHSLRLSLIMLLPFIGLLYKTSVMKYDDTAKTLIRAINPKHDRTYLLDFKLGGPNHGQWVMASGIALRLMREGYSVCIPEEWLFAFPRNLRCAKASQPVKIRMETIDHRKQLLQKSDSVFEYNRTRIHIVP